MVDRIFFMNVFQCEENANLQDCARYLKLPFSKSDLPSNNQTMKGTKESLWITSFLCSTKLTQNGNVCLFVQDMIGQNVPSWKFSWHDASQNMGTFGYLA